MPAMHFNPRHANRSNGTRSVLASAFGIVRGARIRWQAFDVAAIARRIIERASATNLQRHYSDPLFNCSSVTALLPAESMPPSATAPWKELSDESLAV